MKVMSIFLFVFLSIFLVGCKIPAEVVSATQKTEIAVSKINQTYKDHIGGLIELLETVKPLLEKAEQEKLEKAKKILLETGDHLEKLEKVMKKLRELAEKYGEKIEDKKKEEERKDAN